MIAQIIRSRFLALLIGVPFYAGAFISGVNISIDLRIRRALTLNDYVYYLVHQIDRSIKPIFFFSFFSMLILYLIVRRQDPRERRTRKTTYSLILLFFLLLLGICGRSTQDYPAALDGNNFFIEQLQVAAVFTFSICFIAVKNYYHHGTGRLDIAKIFDEQYDAWLFIFLLTLISLDGLQLGYVITHGIPASALTCESDKVEDTKLIGALERGLVLKVNDNIKLISYDCLKAIQIK